jgi:predicted GNAT family acetyltransferase
MTKTLVHEADASRYTMLLDGQVAALADYRIKDNSVSFFHTYTQPALRGQGLAEEVVTFAMDDIEKNTTLRVLPMCWYVADWFERNQDRAALLTR